MEAHTIKPFSELAECVKCGAGDSMPASPMIGMFGSINTRFCPGGKEPEEEQDKNPIHAILSLLPSLGNPLAALKPRINICAGIGEEHLHKTCPRCGFEWLTGTRPAA